MDRTLKVYAKTGHLFAEFTFNYGYGKQATAHYIQYRRLYNDDEEDENKSVYPGMEMDLYLQYHPFDSIDKIKEHDRQLVEKELGRDMTADPKTYNYVYESQPILLRYISETHRGCVGIINVLYSFIDNTKEVKFLSASNPRYDVEISANSLETNISCIERIPVYQDRAEPRNIDTHDLKRLEPWY